MKPIRIVLSPTRSRSLNIFLGIVLMVASCILLLALATYRTSDPSWNTATALPDSHGVHNWIGRTGAWLSDLFLQIVGITAFLIPLWMGSISWTWVRSRPTGSMWLRWAGLSLVLLFVPAIFGLLPWHWQWLHALSVEGVIGRLISNALVGYLNTIGAWITAGMLAAAGLYFAYDISFWALKESAQGGWRGVGSLQDRWRNWREKHSEELLDEMDRPVLHIQPDQEEQESVQEPEETPERLQPGFFARIFHRNKKFQTDTLEDIPAYQRADEIEKKEQESFTPSHRTSIWETASEVQEAVPVAASISVPPSPVTSAPAPPRSEDDTIAIHARADKNLQHAKLEQRSISGFKLPPSTLLHAGEAPQAIQEDLLLEDAKILVEKCAEFGVHGQVVQINPGPMVTTYEFKPEAGVKYSRLTGLDEDLCLAMRAESILIERMAGKNTVGIQVPNREKETIYLRDVVESEQFSKAKSRLSLAMGKDINGRIVTADLATMPHVLIAGSTGSGKSVAINAMIMSLLFRTTPQEVRLILVDPKRVELGMYEGIPHLLTPIITEPKLAANALRNAVREMERRLKLLASRSVRNIDQYNKLFEGSMSLQFDDGEPEEPLPYIVVIIDELADLMMLDRANVEESITRLAQMARAVGIHLVLATQRPSVDVITGLIKANVPTRISFRLATKVDSRTILDNNGAEALLGRGDMLFLPPGTSRLVRLHAPYASEKDTAAVVEFWKTQGQAEYVEGFLEAPKEDRAALEGSSDGAEDSDPLFDDAVRLVFEFGKASTSLLQRRLRIGYGRAAHLVDMMERDGLVGPADGSRPRELLKSPGWLHEVPTADE